MGSGKTTVGRLVAARLGWPMTDSDAWLEAATGRSARAVRDEDGAATLHALEREHLRAALAAPGPSVICPAASVVDDGSMREALRDPGLLVVWLTARPVTAAARFDDQDHRPWYGDDPLAFLAAQALERGPRLRALDPVELATDDLDPEALADEIAGLVARPGRRAGP
jgi:shikimate kinase